MPSSRSGEIALLIKMDFKALFINVKSIIFTRPPFLRSPITVLFLNFGYFVVPDKIKGDFVYLITEVFRDWQYGCIVNELGEAHRFNNVNLA